MSWKNTIEQFLKSPAEKLIIGERTVPWIESFRKDLIRWSYPVELGVESPILVNGKVPVVLLRKGEIGHD